MYDLNEIMTTIPWGLISAQQGNCKGVPDAVLSLNSDESRIRKTAYWQLDNNVIVQGGLFEGAFYVVPFLMRICASETANGRIEALDLLHELASGASSFDKVVRYSQLSVPFQYYLPDDKAVAVPLTIAVRFAVACGLDSIMHQVISDNDAVRKKTRDLFELFPEYGGDIAERLHKIVAQSVRETMRKEIYGLINKLGA